MSSYNHKSQVKNPERSFPNEEVTAILIYYISKKNALLCVE